MSDRDDETQARINRESHIPDELRDLAMLDSTVYGALTAYSYGADRYTAMLEQLVLQLAREKKTYFDAAVKAELLAVRPLVFSRDKLGDWELFDKDGEK